MIFELNCFANSMEYWVERLECSEPSTGLRILLNFISSPFRSLSGTGGFFKSVQRRLFMNSIHWAETAGLCPSSEKEKAEQIRDYIPMICFQYKRYGKQNKSVSLY
jgi:hypothetical protein